MENSKNFKNLRRAIQLHKNRLVALVVHLNDTYLVESRGRRVPGFPKLIATIRELRVCVRRATGRDRVLVLHSGDFLGPSLLAKVDKGKTMVEALNRCGLDYCVLGNHEFDHKLAALTQRLSEAEFSVVLSNITPRKGTIKSTQVALWPEAASPLVAIAGIVSEDVGKAFPKDWTFVDPTTALRRVVACAADVPFRIALTHASRSDDRIVRTALRDCPRAIVLGGHDHHIDWGEDDDYPIIYKNQSNLQTVRVLMLLAGGDHAIRKLVESYESLKAECGGPPIDSRANVERLLGPLHPVDASVLRAWFCGKGTTPRSKSVTASTFDEDDLPDNALAHRLAGLPWTYNQISWKLTPRDLVSARKADADWVKRQLGPIRDKNKSAVVCDFTRETKRLEAREASLRGGPTDFGELVAEAVRRHTKADTVILNSGACRCEELIPARLSERLLHELFLYDCDDAVVVLQMTEDEVNRLRAHGLSQVNSGAYPLLAGKPKPSPQTSRVAIASYVLANEESTDGYAEVLARCRQTTPARLRQNIKVGAERCSVVAAVKAEAANIPYPGTGRAPPIEDRASRFVRLAGPFWRAYKRKRRGSVKGFAEMSTVMRDPKLSPVALCRMRDELRSFLKEIAGSPASRMSNLRALRKEIAQHHAVFADSFAYHALFDKVAECVSPWKA